MACPITPHYILSTLPIGIIIRYPGKFVLHFWACLTAGYTDIKMLIAKDLLLKKTHPETNV